MLNETIAALKAGGAEAAEETWSPLITLGTPVTIPEHYVEDLDLRLGLYRRLSTLEDEAEIETFAAEMIDRFGPMPNEVKQLMALMSVKALCHRAHVEKLEAGPKGIIVGFRNNSFANPTGLVRFISKQGSDAKVRPDMKVVFTGEFPRAEDRLKVARAILRELVGIAAKKG
jgi:transcription-repair coupling factor (superfamily II helicase)